MQQFGPRFGDIGGGGIASVVEHLSAAPGRPHRYGATATMARDRALHSFDLWVRALATLVWLRIRHRRVVAHVHLADGGSLRREGSIAVAAHLLRMATVASVHASELDTVLTSDRAALLRVLRRVDVVHALGPSEAAKLSAALGSGHRIVIIPNAVKMPPSTSPAGSRPASVLFGGVVGRRKGVDVLMDAWPKVREACPEATLVIAGPLDDVEVTSCAGIDVVGPLAPAEIGELLDEARLAVLPSRREALPMFLIEAMSRARPVVATPVGDVASLVPSEWIVPVDDADALATTIIRLLLHPDEATLVGMANRSIVAARFSSEAVHPKFDALYAEMVAT